MHLIEQQMDLATEKLNGESQLVNLQAMNKYVGYMYKFMQVSMSYTSGNLRKFKQQDNGRVVYPNVEFKLDRATGNLVVHDDYFYESTTKFTIKRQSIIEVKAMMTNVGKEASKSKMLHRSNTEAVPNRINRFNVEQKVDQSRELSRQSSKGIIEFDKEQLQSAEQIEHWLRNNDSKDNKYRPNDFNLPFALKTTQQEFVFFAKSESDRQIWIHELSNLAGCLNDQQQQQQQVDLESTLDRQTMQSVRANVMDKIDPVAAFNAWNLSIVFAAQFQKQQNLASNLDQDYSTVKQQNVIEAGTDFVTFIRDSQECYISPVLRKEPFIIDGYLHKELGSKIKRALSGTRKRFLVIDFKRQYIRFKYEREDSSYQDDKQIPFSQILDAKSVIHDDDRTDTEFHFKMLVQVMSRQFILIARTFQERKIWIDGFQKAMSQAKISDKQNLNNADQSTFETENLKVTTIAIVGNVMKRINNQQLWHRNDFHQRVFKLEFGNPFCYFFKETYSSECYKSHKQSDIMSCTILTEQQIEETIQSKKRSKSSSVLRMLKITSEPQHCKWNFGFQLTFRELSYELYSPTRKERDKWVEILSKIADKNSKSMGLCYIGSPDYKSDGSKQEAEIVPQDKQDLTDDQIFAKVHEWMRQNEQKMSNHVLDPPVEYESGTMNLSQLYIQGACFQVKTGQDYKFKFVKIDLICAIQSQTLTIQYSNYKQPVSEMFPFSQLFEVAISDFQMSESELELTKMETRVQHFLKIKFIQSEILVGCPCEQDRDQWIRLFNLILQMRKLMINLDIVNPYVFEHFRQQQLMLYSGQDLDRSLDLIQQVNEESKRQDQTQANPPVQEIVQEQKVFTPTFSMESDSYIEGYLVKGIETKRLLQMTQQHLRFFRIIFAQGKMNIKENRSDRQMRSFNLADVISVNVTTAFQTPSYRHDDMHFHRPNIVSLEEIEKRYPINSSMKFQYQWPFTFKICFMERQFTLSARTKQEMEQWMRVFNLTLQMNKLGIPLQNESPCAFERRNQLVNHGHTDSAVTQGPQRAVQVTEHGSQFDKSVDYGLVMTPATNRLRASETDPVTTSTLLQADRPIERNHNVEEQKIPQQPNHIESKEYAFAKSIASRLSNPDTFTSQQYDNHQQQTSQGQRPPQEQIQQLLKQSQSQAAVVNQNITVQNITIQNMNISGTTEAPNAQNIGVSHVYGDESSQSLLHQNRQRSQNTMSRVNSAGLQQQPIGRRKKKKRIKIMRSPMIDSDENITINDTQLNENENEAANFIDGTDPCQQDGDVNIELPSERQEQIRRKVNRGKFMEKQKKGTNTGVDSSAILNEQLNSEKDVKNYLEQYVPILPTSMQVQSSNNQDLRVIKQSRNLQSSKTTVDNRINQSVMIDPVEPSKVDLIESFRNLSDSGSPTDHDASSTPFDPKVNSNQSKLNLQLSASPEIRKTKTKHDVAETSLVVKPHEITQIEDFDMNVYDNGNSFTTIETKNKNGPNQDRNLKSSISELVLQDRYNGSNQKQESGQYHHNASAIETYNQQSVVLKLGKKKSDKTNQSQMKISLSKVSLHGSTEKLFSVNDAKKALNQSVSKVIRLRNNQSSIKTNPLESNNTESEKFRKIGKIVAPSMKISSLNQNIQNVLKIPSNRIDINTYGMPVKAEVNMDIIKRIGSKSSRSLAQQKSTKFIPSSAVSSILNTKIQQKSFQQEKDDEVIQIEDL